MKDVFLALLNTGINSSWLVLAVIFVSFVFKKAPRSFMCLLWALVALRLVLPVTLTSPVSLVPSYEPIAQEEYITDTSSRSDGFVHFNGNTAQSLKPEKPDVTLPAVEDGVSFKSETGESVTSALPKEEIVKSKTLSEYAADYAWILWIAGVVALFLYAAIGYVRVYLRTRESFEVDNGVWMCDRIKTAFIFGFLKPRIMLPSDLSEKDKEFALLHERAHLARFDHIWRLISFVLLVIHWYNPFVWVAFYFFGRDLEYSCDERVIREQGSWIKREYSLALIRCSAESSSALAIPLAFSEKRVAGRLNNILNYKKPTIVLSVAFALIATVVSVCFMTVPTKADKNSVPDPVHSDSDVTVTEPAQSSSENRSDEAIEGKNLGYSVDHVSYIDYSTERSQREGAEASKTVTFEGKTYDLTYDYTESGSDYYSDRLGNILAFNFDGEIEDFFMSFTDFTELRTPGVYDGSDAIPDDDLFAIADEAIVRIYGDRVNGMLRVDMSSETITDMNTLIRTVSYQKFFGENNLAAGAACYVAFMPKGDLYNCFISGIIEFDESLLDGIHKEDIDAQIDLQMAELYKDVEGVEYEINTPSVREDENGYYLRILVNGSYPEQFEMYDGRVIEQDKRFSETFVIRLD